jgi:hypothetical protein
VNSDEAKEILRRYRPGTADEQEPEVAAALDLARRDPALARWLAEQGALQAALRARFRQIPVPEGLKEQILSERKVRLARSSRRRFALSTAGALGILLLCLTLVHFYPRHQNNQFARFRGNMFGKILRGVYPKMDRETNDPRVIQDYLASKGQGDYTLPGRLAKTTPTGCALLNWNHKPVSMICFASGKAANPAEPDLFLFIIESSALADAPGNSAPTAVPGRFSRLATVSWSSGGKTYLLGGLGNREFIQEHL